jgi:hypothetical protein
MSDSTRFTMDNLPSLSDVETAPAVVAALTKAQTEMTTPAIVAHAEIDSRLRKAVKLLKELAGPARRSWKMESYTVSQAVKSLTGTKPASREEAAELVLNWVNDAWTA